MAGLIKNQILKHLSKFTKNLAADKIKLSTLKGEGDLSDLELDELMLTDLLDLPTWLRLTKATCNKLTIKIQWTKLSSQPICLYLDEVIVEMDTCDTPRTPTSTTPASSYSTGGKYGFAEQIIDGMCVSINSVIVNFRAKDFAASIQLSRILIQSRTPCWQEGSLKLTRLKDDLHGEVMIFKEAEWQTLRIEANARDTGDPQIATTPLRLIANQSKIRITIKKRLVDCSIIASRLQVNLDDLLWVLTNSQLKAAVTFVGSLRDIVARSTEQSKRLAAEKLRRQAESPMRPQTNVPQQTAAQLSVAGAKTGTPSQLKKVEAFARFDIKETSFHVYTGRIELHLCDDMDEPDDGEYQKKVKGGAIQLVLERMAFDSYPYHRAGSDRSHWLRRDENMASRDEWSRDLLSEFRQDVLTVREAVASNNNSPNHTSPFPSSPASHVSKVPQTVDESKTNKSSQRPTAQNTSAAAGSPSTKPATSQLLESCVVLRLEDFVLYRVSSAIDDRRSSPKKFLASDKKQLLLPKNMSSVHVEFTEYYFPDGKDFPVPNSNLFIVVNPLCLTVDYITIEWLNAFLIDMAKRAVHDLGMKEDVQEVGIKYVEKVHVDIRLEALMPRVLLPPTTSLDVDIARQFDGLENLQIQLSKVIVGNCRTGETGIRLRSDLASLMKSIDHGRLVAPSPSDLTNSSSRISSLLRRHADNAERPNSVTCGSPECPEPKLADNSSSGLRADMFQTPASSDIWCVEVEQIWFEFLVIGLHDGSVRRRRTIPFVDSFPVLIWMSPLIEESKTASASRLPISRPPSLVSTKPTSSSSDVCLLVRAGTREMKAQIDHKRLAFLMSLVDTIIQVKEEIDMDLSSAGMTSSSGLMFLSALTSDIRVDLLLAPVDDYSMRPASPDDEDDEDQTRDIGVSPVITNFLDDVPQVDLPIFSAVSDCSVSSGVVEDMTNSCNSLLPPSVMLSGPDLGHSDKHFQDTVSNLSDSLLQDSSLNPLKPDVSDTSITKNSSLPTNHVLVAAPGLNHIPNEAGITRSSVLQRGWSKSSSPPDLKKSINQVFGKISDRMKVRRQDTGWFLGESDADSWDTMSTRSDVASDEDDDATSFIYGLDSQLELPAFERRDVPGNDDVSCDASDTHEDVSDICGELKSPGSKVISVVSVYLHGIEASVTVDNQDVAVDTLLGDLALKERGNISIEKFQEQFISGNRDKKENVPSWSQRPCPVASLHIDVGQLAKRMLSASFTAEDARYLTLSVCNLELELRITTVTHIGELFNDGKESKVLPMQIDASDVFITLLDDQKSLYNEVPPLTPIKFRVKTAAVQRDENGVFHISAGSKVPPFSTALSSSIILPSTDSSIGMGHIDLPADQLSSDLSRRKSSCTSLLLTPDVSARLNDLEHENDLLRRQLEKIGKMDGLAIERSSRPPSREQSVTRDRSAGSGRKEVDRLRKENLELIDRLREQADDLMAVKQERESLLLTIQLLQDDLTASERQRQRQTPT